MSARSRTTGAGGDAVRLFGVDLSSGSTRAICGRHQVEDPGTLRPGSVHYAPL